ncbi:uncharacterized protein LOC113296067 [Papaver somniferum]|uniref:uncharacterized protein LOC113296067 n=1 Tax=Papaver somniferum TaxID=3469 RepID=UPI000E70413F|nr:uncharacterized protein LOC113296067 [Papaver somniferum]
MSVYKWPQRALKDCEQMIRNFLWTGDPSKRKSVVLKCDKVCSPFEEGGLGLRRLEIMNKALLMKFWWKIQNSKEDWAIFFQEKFITKKGDWIGYYKKSSILPGLKWISEDVQKFTTWIVGTGSKISVWNDTWIKDKPLCELYPDNAYLNEFPVMKVENLIVDNEWVMPSELLDMVLINELPVLSLEEDKRIWSGTITGDFSVSSAVECIRTKYSKVSWVHQVWNYSIYPNISSNIWKLIRNIFPTDEKMKTKKFQLASRCCFCKKDEETLIHILWKCNYSELIWKWLGGMFNFKNLKSFDEVFSFAKHKSPAVGEIWRYAAFITLRELWFQRNRSVYEDEVFNEQNIKSRILKLTAEEEIRMKQLMWNTAYDLQMLKKFGMKCRRVKTCVVKEISFKLPQKNQLLLCCYGASRGNPGNSGYGIMARNDKGEVVVAIEGGLGLLLISLRKLWQFFVQENGLSIMVSESFFSVQTQKQQNLRVPWFAIDRWKQICNIATKCEFLHNYRELNFSANYLANRGATMQRGDQHIYTSKPPFLVNLENEKQKYFRTV